MPRTCALELRKQAARCQLTPQDYKVNDMVPKFVYKKTASTMFTKNSINDIQMLARSPSKVDFTELRSLN